MSHPFETTYIVNVLLKIGDTIASHQVARCLCKSKVSVYYIYKKKKRDCRIASSWAPHLLLKTRKRGHCFIPCKLLKFYHKFNQRSFLKYLEHR